MLGGLASMHFDVVYLHTFRVQERVSLAASRDRCAATARLTGRKISVLRSSQALLTGCRH